MRTAGIIAEYDPFHNGHAYHISRVREISMADFVVVVMSGDFTQRGRPALLDKWTRAALAVKNGADLVLELPFCYATASAETFAGGAVSVLEGLGVIDAIGFGCECDDTEDLLFLAGFLKNEPDEYRAALKRHLDMGLSYPSARELAVNECLGLDAGRILKTPNNILAVEYLKHTATMSPVAVKREGDHSVKRMEDLDTLPGGSFASAGSLRDAVKRGRPEKVRGHVPEDVLEEIMGYYGSEEPEGQSGPGNVKKITVDGTESRYFDMLRGVIARSSADELSLISGAVEGIENRLKKELRMHGDPDSFAGAVKTKRFTRTAVDRLLLHVLTGYRKEDEEQAVPYARVLAFNEGGAKVLSEAKHSSSLPVVTNINKYEDMPAVSRFDVTASDIYNVITGRDLYAESDHVKRPVTVAGQSR